MACRLAAFLGATLALGGCGDDPARMRGDGAAGSDVERLVDSDNDGLCDVSELGAGTDPRRPDSDDDGYPDLLEVLAGMHGEANRPAAHELVFLSATRDARVEHEVRVTVEGTGEGHAGAFDAIASPYPDASAANFYAGALAVSGEPPDHVRGLEPDAERFATVLGSTRLSFSLSFRYDQDVAPHPDCRRGYPFRYQVKAEGGFDRSEVTMLLVVAPPGLGQDAPFCLPTDCL
jgi:hypothetical protein